MSLAKFQNKKKKTIFMMMRLVAGGDGDDDYDACYYCYFYKTYTKHHHFAGCFTFSFSLILNKKYHRILSVYTLSVHTQIMILKIFILMNVNVI